MEKYRYKDSGIEWLGKLPEHWKVDRVKDISSLRDEKVKIKSSKRNYLELENIEQGTGRIIDFKDTLEVVSGVMKFKKGDVLFGKLRPYLEKYYLTKEDGYCTGEILAIEPKKVDNLFFKYFIGSPNFIKQCDVFSYGAKMPRVNWQTQIGIFEIPLPPLLEQKAIGKYLEKATTRIDRIIVIKEEQLMKMEESLKSKIKEVIRQGIDNHKLIKVDWLWTKSIPKNWKQGRFKDFLRLSRGHDLPKVKMKKGKYPVFGSNGIIGSHNEFTTNAPGITMGRSGSVGAINFATEDYWAHNTCLYVYQNNGNDWRYLHYFLQGLDLSALSGGSVVGTLNRNYIHKEYIAMPEINEQEKIVERLNLYKAKNSAEIKLLQSQIKTLQSYRKSLIHECVTGKKQITTISQINQTTVTH